MEERQLETTLDFATDLAQQAAELVLEGFRTGAAVRKKGTIDLVTDYDLRSETRIRQSLAEAFPAHRIVAEEGSDAAPTEDELVWYVDPLDGTTNFAHGHPFFCVSIALYRGAEGLIGVVAAPALDTTWRARKGGGAFRNGKRCFVSETRDLAEALCATGFPYDKWTNPDNNERELSAFLRRTHGVRRCGSAAIDLAMTADGTYDVYWEQRLSSWDMCAGALLVREARGTLSDYGGGAADPRSGRLVATNGHLHDAALGVIAGAREGLARAATGPTAVR